MKRLDRTAI